MDLETRLQRWRNWIQGPIQDELVNLVLGRQVFLQYRKIVNGAPEEIQTVASEFHRWVARNYAQAIAAAIRRQADSRNDVTGLARLLEEMARYPRALTRERFLEGVDEMHRDDAIRRWAEFSVSDGGMLDPTRPANDLDGLKSRLANVVKWVNIAVAHHSDQKTRIETELDMTFDELHSAIDGLKEIHLRYQSLLTHETMWLEEVFDGPWDYAFSFPWIPDWDKRQNDAGEVPLS